MGKISSGENCDRVFTHDGKEVENVAKRNFSTNLVLVQFLLIWCSSVKLSFLFLFIHSITALLRYSAERPNPVIYFKLSSAKRFFVTKTSQGVEFGEIIYRRKKLTDSFYSIRCHSSCGEKNGQLGNVKN